MAAMISATMAMVRVFTRTLPLVRWALLGGAHVGFSIRVMADVMPSPTRQAMCARRTNVHSTPAGRFRQEWHARS